MRSLLLNHVTHKRLAFALLIVMAALYVFSVSILLANDAHAYTSGICTAEPTGECQSKEVGPLMVGISSACGNTGDCELSDILQVFINAGNYVIGTVGAVVLLMYVIGGVYMMASGGQSDKVQKGKKYLVISTTGLLIVMFANLGVRAVQNAIVSGSIADTEGYATCAVGINIGASCGDHKVCTAEGACVTICEEKKDTFTQKDGYAWMCIDVEAYAGFYSGSALEASVRARLESGCKTNMCPGGAERRCCNVYQ